MLVFELRVSLLGAEPAVWRRVRVPGDCRLPMVNLVLQMVMGWENRHLHEFVSADRKRYGEVDGVELQPGVLDEKGHRLSELIGEPGDRFLYIYDFGDDWVHEVVLEAVSDVEGEDEPMWCLAGEGACPPEDCGGVPGYLELLGDLLDHDSVGYVEAVELLGEDFDPEAFDCAVFNKAIAGKFAKHNKMNSPEAARDEMELFMELQDFLDSDAVPESAMSIFSLEGFFAALAIHPVTVMPSTWLPFVWDMSCAGHQPEFSSKAQMEKGMGLLFSYMNSVVRQFSDAPDEYVPLYELLQIDQDERRILAAMDWAVGFMLGVMVDEEVWARTFSDEKGQKFLEPVIALTGFPDKQSGSGDDKRSDDKEMLMGMMGDCVLDMQAFWAPWRREYLAQQGIGPTPKAKPRAGGNELCSCGSGKKYKQCCGKQKK
jgi:uncharacterized protein